jgi:hypothetical protein
MALCEFQLVLIDQPSSQQTISEAIGSKIGFSKDDLAAAQIDRLLGVLKFEKQITRLARPMDQTQ